MPNNETAISIGILLTLSILLGVISQIARATPGDTTPVSGTVDQVCTAQRMR